MGKSAGSPPPPPDPAATARAQGAVNKETAIEQARLNRINEYTPFGSVRYSGTGDPNAPYQRVTTLDPREQALLDAQRGVNQRLTGITGDVIDRLGPQLATQLDLSGLPPAPVVDDDARARIEQALYSRLSPQLERDENRLRTSLANRGITIGSKAYNDEIDALNRAKTDARMQTVLAGGGEQSRQFGLGQAARQQALQEQAFARALPLNEVGALMGTTGAVNVPQFGSPPQVGVGAPDLQGATALQYQGQLAANNQRQQARQAAMGGLFGLAGKVAPFFF